MIKRYSREEISKIWELDSKFSYYLKVELAVIEAYYKCGEIEKEAYEHILKTANFNVDRIDEIEKTVNHDVIAFLTCVNEYVGKEYSGYIHKGLTSSDIIDTAFALQIKDATEIILKDLEQRMNDSEGYLPQQLQGGAGGGQGNYFESMAEVEEAINDPKYSKDPTYRAKIAKKITASREAGVLEIK